MNRFEKFRISLLLLLLSVAVVGQGQSPVKEPKKVAIFLYQGVELLDFAGPGEVFSSSGFKTYTVSVDGQELMSQGFLSIRPQYSIDNAPKPDIIVFPGGNSGPSSEDIRVMDWIKKSESEGSFFMSVCTGAGILANSGMLSSFKHVTTFHGYVDGLQAILPNTEVLRNTRFVDNGNVITTAGVSAGIDGALHLVSRIKGLEAAKATAYYMEYDKWNPEKGLVDKPNEYIESLRRKMMAGEKSLEVPKGELPGRKTTPYPGEFKNFVVELNEKGRYREAESVLEEAIKLYPDFIPLRIELANAYARSGKPGPLPQRELIAMVKDGKATEAIARFEKDKKAFPGWKIYDEDEFNLLGYYLLGKRDFETAIRIFLLNVSEFPQSSNAYDSLAEGYLKAGNKEEAVTNYKKSLDLDSHNENARKVLGQIAAK